LKLPPTETVRQALLERRDWAVRTLADLVRCPTVLGREAEGQHYLAGVFDRLGYATRIEPIRLERIRSLPGFSPVDWTLEGKENLVAVHDPGVSEGRSLAFNGHIDVVSPEPVKLWSRDPFDPHIADDDGKTWMYGRGAGDMKGGTISYLWALAALQELGLEPASKVICQSPVEEECTGNGTLAILERGYRADACVIPEPFAESILTHQLGVLWFQVRVLGKTQHVLGASQGVNAIEKSWLFIWAMRSLEADLNRQAKIPDAYRDVEHPLNLNVGIIRGGDWASTVAGECVTRFRFGLFPGEQCAELMRTIEERVAAAAAADPWLRENPPQVEYVGFQAAGSSFDIDGDFGRSLQGAHEHWRGRPAAAYKATCTTDARFYSLYYDTPATCYGPLAEDIHGADERVSIDSMQRVAEVFTSLIANWCGVRKRVSRP
jgi:acetylornithine deacetylase